MFYYGVFGDRYVIVGFDVVFDDVDFVSEVSIVCVELVFLRVGLFVFCV